MAAATSEMVLSRPPERARTPSVRVTSWTEALLWIKGLPVLLHAPRTKGSSIVTVTCLAAIAVIGGLGLLRPEEAVERLGFVPSDPWGIGLAGSFFVHASAFHLLGNAWFLWLFGRGVEEEEEGGARFALLLVGAHLAALAAHAAHDPRSDLPLLGAATVSETDPLVLRPVAGALPLGGASGGAIVDTRGNLVGLLTGATWTPDADGATYWIDGVTAASFAGRVAAVGTGD